MGYIRVLSSHIKSCYPHSIVILSGLTSLLSTTLLELITLEQPTCLLEQFARCGILVLALAAGVVVVVAGVSSTIATSLLLAGAAGADAEVLVAACADAAGIA